MLAMDYNKVHNIINLINTNVRKPELQNWYTIKNYFTTVNDKNIIDDTTTIN